MVDWRAFLCEALHQESLPWDSLEQRDLPMLIEHARVNGVLPLLGVLANTSWPSELVDACRDATRRQAMFELAHREELIRVLGALAAEGSHALLLKGTPLAYSVYDEPHLRPRGDTDLLVIPDERGHVGNLLESLGYSEVPQAAGDPVFCQASWRRRDDAGVTHAFDVHWRINNSASLSRVLVPEELHRRAVAVPALGPHARTLAPGDALLFACVHRIGHRHAPYYVDGTAHTATNRLIWLYDMDRLIRRMSAAELPAWIAMVEARAISAICRDAVAHTHAAFATPLPDAFVEWLATPVRHERSAVFLTGGRFRLLVEDVRAMEGWRERLTWARAIAFPPADYLRRKYDAPGGAVPLLYLRRAASFFLKHGVAD